MRDGIEGHVNEIDGAVEAIEMSVQSHAGDEAGWALALCHSRHVASEASLLWRLSAFLRLEDGVWRLHRTHGSYATDYHETVMGMQHSAFQDLLASAGEIDLEVARGESATAMFTAIVGGAALVESIGDARVTRQK